MDGEQLVLALQRLTQVVLADIGQVERMLAGLFAALMPQAWMAVLRGITQHVDEIDTDAALRAIDGLLERLKSEV